MTRQPNRLPPDARHGFSGGAIDRAKPLSFRLDGRSYEAFAGDTVLSALLAAGVDGAGTHLGEAIGLNEHFAPPVMRAGAGDAARAMPMDRTPVSEGLELRTLGPRDERLTLAGVAQRLVGLMGKQGRSLGRRLDDPRGFEGPWLSLAPSRTIEADIAVVGGGLAGMSAAIAAAEAGERVVLIERRTSLGGDACFFGAVGEAEPPEAMIARLAEKIARLDAITVLLRTDAIGLTDTRIKAHQVEAGDAGPESRVVTIAARRVVLATGCAERLPVFSGNRAPGVSGAIAAFHRAERFGVWLGKRAIVATPHNFGYRLALLASDAGVTVQRVADSRFSPQSRFIDFCKASGITLASGLVPRVVEAIRKEPSALSVTFAVAIDEIGQEAAALTTDLLVAAGSWQPRLELWLLAGGGCHYDEAERRLVAQGAPETVALAGSADGYRSALACMASGSNTVARLLGRKPKPIEDVEVDAIYESRDGATAVAPWRPGRNGAFLDGGLSFTLRPPGVRPDGHGMGAAQMHVLGLGDVAAAIELGAIPAAVAGMVAAERCLGGGDGMDVGWRVTQAADARVAAELPPYLNGRFGPRPQKIVVEARDQRFFEPGCLIYTTSDPADPFAAVGAVIGPSPDGRPGGTAIADRKALGTAATLFVRDTSGAVPVTIIASPKPAVARSGTQA